SMGWSSGEAIEHCIARLKELALLDDRRYAQSYALSKLGGKPVGRQRLARELKAKFIDRRTIDEVLNELFETNGEEELLRNAIQKYVRLHGRPMDRAGNRRLFDHLARRGFDYELIGKLLSDLETEAEYES